MGLRVRRLAIRRWYAANEGSQIYAIKTNEKRRDTDSS